MNALDILDVKIKMDAVIATVAHDEFKRKTLDEIKKFMNGYIVINVKGMFDGEDARKNGFYYRRL